MKKYFFILIILLFTINLFSLDKDLSDYYNTGNEYYKNNNYDSALANYLVLVDNGISNPDLFFNIGNTYYQKGMLGKSLLYFYKAHRLNPSDDDIITNINFLNSMIKNKRPGEYPFLKFSLNFISLLFLLLFAFLVIILILRIIINNHTFKFITLYLIIILIISNLGVGLWLYHRYSYEILSKTAVVVVDVLPVYSGPAEAYDKITEIYEGIDIEIIEERYGFYRIKIFGNDAGWVNTEGVSLI